jgi:hypothetical protein
MGVPDRLRLPPNVFIIGTVNVDETTYMFSPKVLDRANVIEFRVNRRDVDQFLEAPKSPSLPDLDGKGADFAELFVKSSKEEGILPVNVQEPFRDEMMLYFDLLRQHDAEFGYRVVYESARFVHFYRLLRGDGEDETAWFRSAVDAVIVQKLLPKLHGSRAKLEGALWALAWACGMARTERNGMSFSAQLGEASQALDEIQFGPEAVLANLRSLNSSDPYQAAHYPLSYEKVMRMWRRLVRDQFVAFAEA